MKITVSINTLVDVDGKKVPHPINEISLEVRMKTTVKELKGEIFRKTQIPIGNQVLETSGILLDQDNITLANCLIRDGDTVSVTVKDGILNSANSGQMSFDKKPDIDMGGVMGDIVEHDDDDMDMVDFGTFPTAPTATGAAAPTFIPGSKSFFPEAPKLFEKKGSVPSIVDDERDSNDSTAELQPSFTQTQPPQVHKDERCSCKCGKSECECGSHSGDDGEEEEDFDKMMAEIKEENAKKIQSMSQSEIDSALKEIYSALPANVIESMKKKAAAEVSQSHPQVHKDEHCSCKCGKSECECGSHGGGDGEEEEEEEEDFDKMMAEIKEENAKKIQSMSQSEIDSALKEIYSALPANVIESMKKKAAAEMPQPSKTAEKQSASVKQAERAREWPKKAESRSANNNTGILAHISTASKDSPEAVKAANEVIDVLNAIYKRDSARARKAPNPLAEWNADAEPPAVVPDVRDVETADIRFGFDGAIIPPGTDIPTSAGLHHHGGDQWAAGYTINELCVLMRSSFPSQRVEALRIVENILTRARNREYDRTDVRVVMVQKFRVPYLIRIAMDDKQVSVISAAVNTLHALVVDPRELQLEQIMEACYRGDEHQDYTAYTRKDPATADSSDDDDSDEPYVPDEDYAALDLLNGLLSLNTAERLRYLLQVAPLDGLEIPIVEIIDRLAHYSAAACAKVVETPFMIDALVERVLGLKENPALALLSAQTLRHLCQSTSDCCCRVVTNELFSKVFSNYFEAAGKLAVLPEHIGVQEEILAIYRAAARFGCLKDKLPKIPADFVGPIPATLSFLSACCKESSPYDEVSAEYALKAARILNSFAEMRAAKLSVVDLKTLSAVLHFLAIFIGNPSNSALCESALFAPLMRFLSSPYMSLITLEVFKKLRFDESKVDLLFFYRCLVDCGLPRVVDGRNDDANISTDANSTPTYDDNDFAAFGVHCLSGSVLSGLFFSFVRIFESCRSEDFLERVRYALDEKTPILVSISASIPPASPLNKLSVNSNKSMLLL